MGGAYLTLLNTIANMGYLLPKTPLFWAMDLLTQPSCSAPGGTSPPPPPPGGWASLSGSCPKKLRDMGGPSACTAAGGACALAASSDGYYWVSCCSLALGVALGLVYLRSVRGLMALPLHKWRATAAAGPGAGSAGADAAAASKRAL